MTKSEDLLDRLSEASTLREALSEIAHNATVAFEADVAVLWLYDAVQNTFVKEGHATKGIPEDWAHFLRDEEKPDETAYTVLNQRYVVVEDVDQASCPFATTATRELLVRAGIKSFQGIALTAADEKVGVLYVCYKRLRIFGEEEKHTAQSFANYAALALKKTKLLEEVNKARNAARVVVEMTAIGDLQSTLQSIAKGAQEVLSCDTVTLYAYNAEHDKFSRPYVAGLVDGRDVAINPVEEQSIIDRCRMLDDLHIAETATEDRLTPDSFVYRDKIASSVGLPLITNDEKVGVMFVNYRTHHRITEDELTTIRLFASQAAVGIRNAQLYERAQRRTRALESLYQAEKAISARFGPDRKKLIDQIIMRAVESIRGANDKKAVLGTIHLYDEETKELVLESIYSAEDPGLLKRIGDRISIDRVEASPRRMGIIGRTAFHKEAQLVRDVRDDADFVSLDQTTMSELAVPLLDAETLVGVLNLESHAIAAFDEDDLDNLRVFAELAVIAIKTASQHEELTRTKVLVATRTALAWMGMASNYWHHSIRNRAFDVRNNITLIRKKNDRSGPDEKLPPWVEELLTRIEDQATRILGAEITLTLEKTAPDVEINSLIIERLNQLWSREPYSSVFIGGKPETGKTLWARISPEWLRHALDTLIDNAVEELTQVKRSHPSISVHTRSDQTSIEIIVADNGRGISPKILNSVLKEPIQKAPGDRGSGMGLLMAQAVLETYGGKLNVKATGSTGTSMSIKLPRRTGVRGK